MLRQPLRRVTQRMMNAQALLEVAHDHWQDGDQKSCTFFAPHNAKLEEMLGRKLDWTKPS